MRKILAVAALALTVAGGAACTVPVPHVVPELAAVGPDFVVTTPGVADVEPFDGQTFDCGDRTVTVLVVGRDMNGHLHVTVDGVDAVWPVEPCEVQS